MPQLPQTSQTPTPVARTVRLHPELDRRLRMHAAARAETVQDCIVRLLEMYVPSYVVAGDPEPARAPLTTGTREAPMDDLAEAEATGIETDEADPNSRNGARTSLRATTGPSAVAEAELNDDRPDPLLAAAGIRHSG